MKDIVGTTMIHEKFGKVKVLSRKERSRTIVLVKLTDRGRGWSKELKKYIGWSCKLKNGIGWSRGENKAYGKTEEVHIKDLN